VRVPATLLEKSRRLETAYLKMGAMPTWTCAPYQQGLIPAFGEQIAWGESNAVAFVNSVIGARTERYADLTDICAGITGRVPALGLHLAENRKAEVLISLADIPQRAFNDPGIYPLLEKIEGCGVKVFTDGCSLQYPKASWDFTCAMSDSVKYANYCFSQTGLNVIYAGTRDCVETAVSGELKRGRAWT
jgi:predicted aconitase